MSATLEHSPLHSALIGRQPIFETDQQVFGYELLYRDGNQNSAQVLDGNEATARVLVNTFCELGFDQIVGTAKAFINMTDTLFLDHLYEILPPEQVVLEVLETVKPTPELIQSLKRVRQKGYLVALDDFVFGEEYRKLVELAHIIKFDVMALNPAELESQVKKLKAYPLRFLAEKVESLDVFLRCQKLGFELFQGYYFCKPEIIKGARLSNNRMSLVLLLAKLQQENIPIPELEELIKTDLALSVKLLRYVNSAFVGLPKSVGTISQAICMVGTDRMRQWASVMVLANFDTKPLELMRVALIRAKMCEEVCQAQSISSGPGFTVGLFSVLDAFFDCDMSQLMEKLPLSEPIQLALLERKGELGMVLENVMAYEQNRWDDLTDGDMTLALLRNLYWQSIGWTDQVLKAFR
ncbi:MAG: EAL and HDOD domain-containing protein [Nitrospirales bacterium]